MTRREGLEAIFAGDVMPFDPADLVTSIVGAEQMERFRLVVQEVVESQLEYHALMIEAAWMTTRADMRYTLHEVGLDEGWIEDFGWIEGFGCYDPWAIACRLPPRGATFELIGFDEGQAVSEQIEPYLRLKTGWHVCRRYSESHFMWHHPIEDRREPITEAEMEWLREMGRTFHVCPS